MSAADDSPADSPMDSLPSDEEQIVNLPVMAMTQNYARYVNKAAKFIAVMYPFPVQQDGETHVRYRARTEEVIALRQTALSAFRAGALMSAARAYVAAERFFAEQ